MRSLTWRPELVCMNSLNSSKDATLAFPCWVLLESCFSFACVVLESCLRLDQSGSRLITAECDKTVKIYREDALSQCVTTVRSYSETWLLAGSLLKLEYQDPNATPETHPLNWKACFFLKSWLHRWLIHKSHSFFSSHCICSRCIWGTQAKCGSPLLSVEHVCLPTTQSTIRVRACTKMINCAFSSLSDIAVFNIRKSSWYVFLCNGSTSISAHQTRKP